MRQLSVAPKAKCFPRVLVAGLAALPLLISSPTLFAQQSSGLSSALQALGGMSSDQQQSLLQKVLGQSGSNSTLQSNANMPQGQNGTGMNAQQNNALKPPGSSNQPQSVIPTIGPDDTVLININLPGEKTTAQVSADINARDLTATALQIFANQNPITPSLQSQAQSLANSATGAALATNGGTMPLPGVVGLAAAQSPATISAANNPPSPTDTLPQRPATVAGSPSTTTSPPGILDPQQLDADRNLVKVLRANNPYKLDHDGVLSLPGFRDIELNGLTEAEATRRVAAEPALQDFEIRVMRLPVAKTGRDALLPYGYDLFQPSLQGLAGVAPVSSTPVPVDYVIGPDDVLEVQIYGNQNYNAELTVNRDGTVNFPQLGPITVGGRRYSAVKAELESRVEKQMIGVRASVSMGETRTINVFVLGEANYPGTYTVTGLATVTTALFAAGGVKTQGSLRRIQVRRQGALVRQFDLYDLLMRGDSSADVKLMPGDIIMIPSVGPTAAVEGQVQRPAIYELKGETSVASLVEMAGGLTPEADPGTGSLVHVNANRERVVIGVKPGEPSASAQSVGNGDYLRVAALKPTIDSGITLQGYVYRPGNYAWHPGSRLTDVIGSVDELKPSADQGYVLIRRVVMPGRYITALSADLGAALKSPNSAANVALQPRDTVTVFDLQTGRDRIIQPLMQELTLQANLQQPTSIVHVDGKVKVPGDYPLEQGMRVSDLIRAGGNLDSSAYGGHAELSRYVIEKGEQRRTVIMPIDLAAVAHGDESANITLEPFDQLSVKEISGWDEQDQVTLMGEVRFPGNYTIKRGETLRSVIARAGGLTDLAFPEGSVFMREELRNREQEQLDRLADRMQSDIASIALMAARASQSGATAAYSVGQSLLAQIQSTKAVGRLVIDLKASINAKPGSSNDIVMRNNDQLVVPKQRQDVMVLGEVQSASSHLYQPDLSRDDYIAQSGGATSQADLSKVYVVRADGSVATNQHRWIFSSDSTDIHAGDAIVVPLDTERLPALPTWQAVTQILYNLAIAVAAVHAL